MDSKIHPTQKCGRDLYRRKDYKAAIECFSTVITKYRDPPPSVFDNRAAAYAKTGDLPAALRDGKRIIHMAKSDVTGYLRTSQVLQLMGKEEVALGIYKYGLRNVPTSDPDIKLLRGMYDKLAAKCAPPKAIDPLLILPFELVELVISYLSFNHLVSLLRVSKSWSHLLESMPKLWRHLDLSKAKKNVRRSAIKDCVRRSKGTLTHATLYRFENSKYGELLPLIVYHCKNLEYLEVLDGPANASLLSAAPLASKLTTLISGAYHETTLDMVTQLLARCHSLTRAEFHHVRSTGLLAVWSCDLSGLRVLTINAAAATQLVGMSAVNLELLVSKIPQIQELSLQGWKTSTGVDFSPLIYLSILDLSRFQSPYFPSLPPSLRILDMTDCYRMDFSLAASRTNLAAVSLPNLTSFSLSSVRRISLADLHHLLAPSAGKLTKLDIGGCPFDANADSTLNISEIVAAGYLAEVEELGLRNTLVDDAVAKVLALNLAQLRVVDVAFTKITGVGVKALCLKSGNGLERLNLQHCTGVSFDAVEWARGKGVEVLYSFPETGKGKKIRLG